MRILVIAPHPDDEVLGCGGTIAKYSEMGYKIYLLIATKTYSPDWPEDILKTKPIEIKKVNKILGIEKTYFLNFPTVKLDTIPQKELNDSIVKIVETVKPEIVYIPHKGDINKDHRIIYESSIVALRPIKNNIKKILSYEILSETEWGRELSIFKPNVYENISKTYNKKIEAMNVYKDELRKYPHPRSIKGIEILARRRGTEINVEFAEAYMLIREFIE